MLLRAVFLALVFLVQAAFPENLEGILKHRDAEAAGFKSMKADMLWRVAAVRRGGRSVQRTGYIRIKQENGVGARGLAVVIDGRNRTYYTLSGRSGNELHPKSETREFDLGSSDSDWYFAMAPGSKSARLTSTCSVKLGPTAKWENSNVWELLLVPKEGQDASDFKDVRLYLDRATYHPLGFVFRSELSVHTLVLKNIVWNGPSLTDADLSAPSSNSPH